MTLEERLREELRAAAAELRPPDIVGDVRRRLTRRRRRHAALAATASTAAVITAVTIMTLPGHGRVTSPAPSPSSPSLSSSPHPSTTGAAAVTGPPTLVDAEHHRTLAPLRSIALAPNTQLVPMTPQMSLGASDDDAAFVLAEPAGTTDTSSNSRLLRIDGNAGTVTTGRALSTFTSSTPRSVIVAYGQVWVGTSTSLLGFDEATLGLTHQFPLQVADGASDAVGAQLAAAGGYLWVTAGRNLDRLDPKTGVVKTISATHPRDEFFGVTADVRGTTLYTTEAQPRKGDGTMSDYLATLRRRDPITGVVLASSKPNYYWLQLAGIVDGNIWLRLARPGMSGDVAEVDGTTFDVRGGFAADNTIDVVVSGATAWVSSGALEMNHHLELFGCVDKTGNVAATFNIAGLPDADYDSLPPRTYRPTFLASGEHVMFTAVTDADGTTSIVVYPADPACRP